MSPYLMPPMLQERMLSREKKVGKQFQYDMPSDLLMTFLTEVRQYRALMDI